MKIYHSKKSLRVQIAAAVGLVAVLSAMAFAYFRWLPDEESISTTSSNTVVSETKTQVSPKADSPKTTEASPIVIPAVSTPVNRSGQIAIPISDQKQNGKLRLVYFDTVSLKTLETIEPQVEYSTGGSVDDNSKIQYDDKGNLYIYYGQLGGMGGDDYEEYAQIKSYPSGETILRTTVKKEGGFSQWLINKEGTKIYVALPEEPQSAESVKKVLYLYDLATKQMTMVAKLGNISGPLYFNQDQSKIYVGESRYRVENGNQFSGDEYLKTIILKTGTVSEAMIYKRGSERMFPTPSVDGFSFGPKFLKAAYDVGVNGKHTLQTVNINDQKTEDIFDLQSSGQTYGVQWSPDGMKLLFSVGALGTVPATEGVWVYDYNTKKATQIFKSNITNPMGESKGQVRPLPNSYNGTSFVYKIDGKVYYYDIPSRKKYLVSEVEADYDIVDTHRY